MSFLGHKDDTFSPEIKASSSECVCHMEPSHMFIPVPALTPPNNSRTVNYMFEMLDAAGAIHNHSAWNASLLRPDPMDNESVVNDLGQPFPQHSDHKSY